MKTSTPVVIWGGKLGGAGKLTPTRLRRVLNDLKATAPILFLRRCSGLPAETRRRRKLYKASGRCRRGSLEKCLVPSFVARRRGSLEEAAEDPDVSWSLKALVG